MLKAFARTSPRILSATKSILRFPTIIVTARAMASGAHSNEELKVSKLFDVSNFTAVVVGIIGLKTVRVSLYR